MPCTYCGSKWHTEKDHVTAESKGGMVTVDACRPCNRSKGDKSLTEWLRDIKENDKYRWRRIKEYNYGRKNSIAKEVQKIRDEK
ncbi:MAG: HNH endonuclease [Promethearchaeota archaeon]